MRKILILTFSLCLANPVWMLLDAKGAETGTSTATSALDIFRRRILPILRAPNPSSCSECHLSGVDLKDYIREDQTATFAALRDAGLINIANPDQSKLLTFIARRPARPSLVTDKIREQELAGFREWIHAAVKDPALTAAKTAEEKLGPKVALEVLRHAREDRVLDSFITNIWSEIGRCSGCHSPDRNQQQVKKFGEQVSWIKLNDPRGTLAHLLESDLIDLEKPERSLLLLKPTKQVDHGGGIKMTIGDRSYTQFHRFILDYAATKQGAYQSPKDLPGPVAELSAVSEIWMKLQNVPAKFDKMVLRVDLFRWDEAMQAWSKSRVATADRQVAGDRQLWQQHLTITSPTNSNPNRTGNSSAKNLPQPILATGRYLAKIYVDQEDRLRTRFPYELGDDELVGQVEINSRWPKGYGQMTVVNFPATSQSQP